MILDEADSMTEGAQQALRMIISSNSDSTRFVLCCNDSGKIIDAIQSRCIVMRFSRLSDDEVRLNLKRIIENEKVRISENALKTLLFISDGDMRKAVNNLQACYQFLGSKLGRYKNNSEDTITEDVVLNICDAPNAAQIKEMIMHAYSANVNAALAIIHQIFKEGHSTYDIVNTIYKVLVSMENDLERQKLLEVLR
jgi:replication factor C subunit 2/4